MITCLLIDLLRRFCQYHLLFCSSRPRRRVLFIAIQCRVIALISIRAPPKNSKPVPVSGSRTEYRILGLPSVLHFLRRTFFTVDPLCTLPFPLRQICLKNWITTYTRLLRYCLLYQHSQAPPFARTIRRHTSPSWVVLVRCWNLLS